MRRTVTHGSDPLQGRNMNGLGEGERAQLYVCVGK